MASSEIGSKSQKLPKTKGFFRIKDGDTDKHTFLFVRDCKIIYDDSNVQVDNPGINPIYTRLTDEVGSFEFTLGNTFDLYGASVDATKKQLYTQWQEGIRKTDFIEFVFIRELLLPDAPSTTNAKKRILLTSKFRVKSCGDIYSQDEAIDDIVVSGAVLDDTGSTAIQAV